MSDKLELTPIGYFHSLQTHTYDAGRQPDENSFPGYIELDKGHNFEQALTGLSDFSHIWILFQFHHNDSWKPMVLPPRGSSQKVGVFATRSPYRPNSIGMSAVKLVRIDGLKIHVGPSDLLDGTPIFDIKPYLAYCDAITEANEGWIQSKKYGLRYSPAAEEMLEFLEKNGLVQVRPFIQHQLEHEPTDSRRKRVKELNAGLWELAYRTWRISFICDEHQVSILSLYSGYSPEELGSSEDPYQDKDLHRSFCEEFK